MGLEPVENLEQRCLGSTLERGIVEILDTEADLGARTPLKVVN